MPISEKRIAEIATIPDKDIDLSDVPELDEEFFIRARTNKLRQGERAFEKAFDVTHDRR